MSRPAWARGLKLVEYKGACEGAESRPAWARGLKRNKHIKSTLKPGVAPRVGAWIETSSRQ